MTSLREHRLIYRTDTVRYNARTAEANATVQDETRKQSLLQGINNDQKTATDPNTKAYLSQQAKVIGATTPQEQAILDEARQRLGESQAVYTNQSKGNASQYDTATGQVTAVPQQGVIEQSRNDRLDAAGATPEQRATNEQNLQGIMNASELQPITNAGVVETPVQFEQRKAAVEAQNTERQKQQQMQQDRQKITSDQNAANAAAGSKAAEKSAPVQDTGKMDRVNTIIDGIIGASGDPMGPVYKEMMLQDLQDMEDAKTNAALSRDASMQRAEDQDNDVQNLIDKYTKIHRENNDKYTALLDETRDSQQKYLAEQEQRDKEKLTWDQDMETQKLTRQKTQQLLSQSIQNALGGGAFSGAANEQLASTEREWDTAISNLAKEFSFKKIDVSAFYTQKYVDTNNQFNMDVFNAAKQLDEKVEAYAMQGFNSLQAKANAETAAQNQYRTDVTAAKTKYSESIKGYVKEMGDTLREEKKLKAAEKKAEEDREWQERKFYENMDYQYDKAEIAVKKESAKVEKADEKLVRTEFTRLSESPTVKDYATIRNNAQKARSVLETAAQKGTIDQGAAKEVVGVLFEKTLDPTSVVRAEEYKRAGLAQGIWKKAEQAISILQGGDTTGLSQDLIDSFMETIEVMTASQKASAQAEYLGAINRMVEFNAQSEVYNINPATLSLPAGISIPEWASKAYYEDQETSGGSSFDVDWNDESSFDAGGGSGFGDNLVSLGRVTQDFDTPIASKANGGLYDPSTVQAWGGKHAGLDLAVPQGSKFSSLIDGEIVDFGYTDGWGGTVVVKDNRGAEHRISHLSDLSPELQKGAKIKKGQILAKTGGAKGTKGAGNSTGAHIDYRVRYNGAYVDPTTYSPA